MRRATMLPCFATDGQHRRTQCCRHNVPSFCFCSLFCDHIKSHLHPVFFSSQNHSVVNVRRKWFVAPGLTCEFVNYYHGEGATVPANSVETLKLLEDIVNPSSFPLLPPPFTPPPLLSPRVTPQLQSPPIVLNTWAIGRLSPPPSALPLPPG